ncbi:hypothetical protein [Ekhidna sp.]
MKFIFSYVAFLAMTALYAQSYVDSGIRHYAAGEFEEALIDFKDAADIESMITESSRAKLYFYRGMIWLSRAEKSPNGFPEIDPLKLSYDDLTKVLSMDDSWKAQIDDAYSRLYTLILEEADNYLKQVKKEDELDQKLKLLDSRNGFLDLAVNLDVSAMPVLYLAQTNKQAGDLIFEGSKDFQELQIAKKYYEESLKHFEQARYEDPFSKKIIQDLLTISTRLGDSERIDEYNKLLELAGG